VLQGSAVGIYPDAGDALLPDDDRSGEEATLDAAARVHLSGRDAGTTFRRYTCLPAAAGGPPPGRTAQRRAVHPAAHR
jgi:hypothetical protein